MLFWSSDEQSASKHADADRGAALGAVKRPQLDRELVLARVAVADQFLRARIEVLLGAPDALLNGGGAGWFRIFTPPPGPSVTSIRYRPGFSSPPPG